MDKTSQRIICLMIEKIERAIEIVNTYSSEEIESNYILSDSLMYEFEKLYEDCTRLSAEVIINYPEIPINELRSIRNRVAHNYESVIISILVDTAKNDLPKFKEILSSIKLC